jgi:hypothetical protein
MTEKQNLRFLMMGIEQMNDGYDAFPPLNRTALDTSLFPACYLNAAVVTSVPPGWSIQ